MARDAPRLVDEQLTALGQIRSYRRVPEQDLRRSCQRNVIRVIASLRGDTDLPPEVVEDERESGPRRALQGIPSEDVVEAYRAVLAVFRDDFFAEASTLDIPLESVLLGTRRLWQLTDRFRGEVVSARHQVDLDRVRREERERLTFLHDILTGTLEASELVEGGAAYGIQPSHAYWVLRARPGSDMAAEELIPVLNSATAAPPLATLLGVVEGDVAGVTGKLPDRVPAGTLVAAQGPVLVTGLHQGFVEAATLLEIAVRYGLRGLVTPENMSMRAAVAQNERLGEALYDRYVAGVLAESRIGAVILESVRAYLDGRRSIPAAAQALNVHVNTLRYRLERFEAITGADLGDTVTTLEVWWALQYALIRPTDGRVAHST